MNVAWSDRFLRITIALSLCLQDCSAQAAGETSDPGSQARAAEELLPGLDSGLSNLAVISARYRGRTGATAPLILIRDLHADPQAQVNISRILKILHERHGYTRVFLEGAEGPVDTSFIDAMHDHNLRFRLAQRYVHRGVMSGAEALKIQMGWPSTLQLWGVEDSSLYIKNFSAFRQVLSYAPAVRKTMTRIRKSASRRCRSLFSPEFLRWRANERAFYQGKRDLASYWKNMKALGLKQGMNWKNHNALVLFERVRKMERDVQANEVRRQQDEWIATLSRQASQETLRNIVKMSLRVRAGKAAPLEFLQELRRPAPVAFDERKHLARYLRLLQLQERIDREPVFIEMNRFSDALGRRLLRNARERSFYKKMRQLDRWDAFLKLRADRGEAQDFLPEVPSFRSWLDSLREEMGPPSALINSEEVDRIERCAAASGRFYQNAYLRDQKLLENTLQMTSGSQTGILITGGFHTEGIEESLKRRGISYCVLTARAGGELSGRFYEQLMLDPRMHFLALKLMFGVILGLRDDRGLKHAIGREALEALIEKLRRNSGSPQNLQDWTDQIRKAWDAESVLTRAEIEDALLRILTKNAALTAEELELVRTHLGRALDENNVLSARIFGRMLGKASGRDELPEGSSPRQPGDEAPGEPDGDRWVSLRWIPESGLVSETVTNPFKLVSGGPDPSRSEFDPLIQEKLRDIAQAAGLPLQDLDRVEGKIKYSFSSDVVGDQWLDILVPRKYVRVAQTALAKKGSVEAPVVRKLILPLMGEGHWLGSATQETLRTDEARNRKFFEFIGLEKFWEYSGYGEGGIVAGVDTGLSPHPALDEARVAGRIDLYGDGLRDGLYHGTHTIGTMASGMKWSLGNALKQWPFPGAGPGLKVFSEKIFPSSERFKARVFQARERKLTYFELSQNATESDFLASLIELDKKAGESGIKRGVASNHSYGARFGSSKEALALRVLTLPRGEGGIAALPVVSKGNEGPGKDSVKYPAGYENTIGVGAVYADLTGRPRITHYSSIGYPRNPVTGLLDFSQAVMAPGGDAWKGSKVYKEAVTSFKSLEGMPSPVMDANTVLVEGLALAVNMAGTSMSAPFVTAIVEGLSLGWSRRIKELGGTEEFTVETASFILERTARDLGYLPNLQSSGLIQADKAWEFMVALAEESVKGTGERLEAFKQFRAVHAAALRPAPDPEKPAQPKLLEFLKSKDWLVRMYAAGGFMNHPLRAGPELETFLKILRDENEPRVQKAMYEALACQVDDRIRKELIGLPVDEEVRKMLLRELKISKSLDQPDDLYKAYVIAKAVPGDRRAAAAIAAILEKAARKDDPYTAANALWIAGNIRRKDSRLTEVLRRIADLENEHELSVYAMRALAEAANTTPVSDLIRVIPPKLAANLIDRFAKPGNAPYNRELVFILAGLLARKGANAGDVYFAHRSFRKAVEKFLAYHKSWQGEDPFFMAILTILENKGLDAATRAKTSSRKLPKYVLTSVAKWLLAGAAAAVLFLADRSGTLLLSAAGLAGIAIFGIFQIPQVIAHAKTRSTEGFEVSQAWLFFIASVLFVLRDIFIGQWAIFSYDLFGALVNIALVAQVYFYAKPGTLAGRISGWFLAPLYGLARAAARAAGGLSGPVFRIRRFLRETWIRATHHGPTWDETGLARRLDRAAARWVRKAAAFFQWLASPFRAAAGGLKGIISRRPPDSKKADAKSWMNALTFSIVILSIVFTFGMPFIAMALSAFGLATAESPWFGGSFADIALRAQIPANITGVLFLVPQIWTNYKIKSTQGVSLNMIRMVLAGSLLFFVYTVAIGETMRAAQNFAGAIFAGIQYLQAWWYQRPQGRATDTVPDKDEAPGNLTNEIVRILALKDISRRDRKILKSRLSAVHPSGPRITDALTDALERGSEKSIRLAAVAALGTLADPRGVKALVDALRNRDRGMAVMLAHVLAPDYDTVPNAAVAALAAIGTPALETLEESLKEENDPTVRARIREAISRIHGASGAIGPWTARLNHPPRPDDPFLSIHLESLPSSRFRQTHDLRIRVRPLNADERERLYRSATREYIPKAAALKDPETRAQCLYILQHLLERLDDVRIMLDHDRIDGFGDRSTIAVSERVFRSETGFVALFHEAGHSYYDAHPADRVRALTERRFRTVHELLRGIGRKERRGRNASDLTAGELGLQDELFGGLNAALTDEIRRHRPAPSTSRRDFLRIVGLAAISASLGACATNRFYLKLISSEFPPIVSEGYPSGDRHRFERFERIVFEVVRVLPPAHQASIKKVIIHDADGLDSEDVSFPVPGFFHIPTETIHLAGGEVPYNNLTVQIGKFSSGEGENRFRALVFHESGHAVYFGAMSRRDRNRFVALFKESGSENRHFVNDLAKKNHREDEAETFEQWGLDSKALIRKAERSPLLAEKVLLVARSFVLESAGRTYVRLYDGLSPFDVQIEPSDASIPDLDTLQKMVEGKSKPAGPGKPVPAKAAAGIVLGLAAAGTLSGRIADALEEEGLVNSASTRARIIELIDGQRGSPDYAELRFQTFRMTGRPEQALEVVRQIAGILERISELDASGKESLAVSLSTAILAGRNNVILEKSRPRVSWNPPVLTRDVISGLVFELAHLGRTAVLTPKAAWSGVLPEGTAVFRIQESLILYRHNSVTLFGCDVETSTFFTIQENQDALEIRTSSVSEKDDFIEAMNGSGSNAARKDVNFTVIQPRISSHKYRSQASPQYRGRAIRSIERAA